MERQDVQTELFITNTRTNHKPGETVTTQASNLELIFLVGSYFSPYYSKKEFAHDVITFHLNLRITTCAITHDVPYLQDDSRHCDLA
jgi:hypothetical protein